MSNPLRTIFVRCAPRPARTSIPQRLGDLVSIVHLAHHTCGLYDNVGYLWVVLQVNGVEGKGRMNGLAKGIERIRGNDNLDIVLALLFWCGLVLVWQRAVAGASKLIVGLSQHDYAL